jgi:hypothetical protein
MKVIKNLFSVIFSSKPFGYIEKNTSLVSSATEYSKYLYLHIFGEKTKTAQNPRKLMREEYSANVIFYKIC